MRKKITILNIIIKSLQILSLREPFHQEITMLLIENMKILEKIRTIHLEQTKLKVIISTQTSQVM